MYHDRQLHSTIRPYHCPYCGAQFKTKSELNHHVRIHTGAKPYSCRHCSSRFVWKNQLKLHLLRSHNEGTWFTCHICHKKFSCSAHLKIHLRQQEDVNRMFAVNVLSFWTADVLKTHQQVHSTFKQFCCGKCGKYFKCKYYVARHFERCSDNRLGIISLS